MFDPVKSLTARQTVQYVDYATTIVPVGGERSRMVELRIALRPNDWVVGEAIRVSVPSATPIHGVAEPRDALVLRDNQVYVFKIVEGGTAERISVELGDGSAELISVRGALRAGDRVVIRGAERLQNGQIVKILTAPSRNETTASTRV